MTTLGYLIWFAATAAMTFALLSIGTLAAAGLLPRRETRRRRTRSQARRPSSHDGRAA
jgi:hypothetical protein